ARSIDCFKEILRLKGPIVSNLMNEIVLGLQAVQSLSEGIEAALREIAVRAQNANDQIDISKFIKVHISCFNLINNIMQILHDKMTSGISQNELFLMELGHQSSVFSNVRSCIFKASHSVFVIVKVPALKKKLSQNNELLQLSSTWHKKAFKVLEDFLKFVTEFLPSLDKLNMRRYEMLATDISDVCNGLILIAETSVSDYPTLNLSWKYIIKLSIEYKNDIIKKRLKSINSDVTFLQEPSNIKQIDKTSTIVRFYITHLLSIVKCYVDVILKNEYKHIIRTILYALIFIVSKSSPNCLITTYASNLLQERILPIVNNIFAALFLNNIACEDERYTMIFNFTNLSIDAMNRENSVIPEIIETVDFTFAKIHLLQIILININDISDSLQSRLLPNPLLVRDSKQAFCILRTFFDILEDYPESNLLTSTIMSIDKSMHPLQNISQHHEDNLYIHILSTLCIFANMLPTFLFIVFEYRMLESLLFSRSFIICTLIVDCWGCVSKILDSHVLYQEVVLIMEIIVGLVHTSSTRCRLKRLFKRLIAFLDVEQQLELSKLVRSYTFQTGENTAQMLSSREYTTAYVNDIENNSVNYVKLYAWINSYLEKKPTHSVDDLFSIASITLKSDIKYILFNIALNILKSINCIDSIPDFYPSSAEFRKILVTIDGVLEFMINLQLLTLSEVLEVLKVVDHCTPLLVNNCICHTSLCNFIDKFTKLLLETNDKQIVATVNSIYERIFTSTRWFTKHEAIAQIASYAQHSRSLEIIHPAITQQLREPIMKFMNRMPSYFDDELVSEINFWRSLKDRDEQKFHFVKLKDLFNRDLISIATNIFSSSVKIDYDINKSTLECLKGAHLVNVFIRNYLAGNQKSEVSSELKLVFNDLKDNLTKFFQS
ncbi:17203_t:CDS:10, partial [Dentiscutata erythropus]